MGSKRKGRVPVVARAVAPRLLKNTLARLQCHARDIAKSLDQSCEQFADWRWTTLSNVAGGLKRMEVALCQATASLQVKGLATRDSTQAKQFSTAMHSSLFQTQCHALDKLARPVRDFSSWLRACPCHERQCVDVAECRCPW